MKALIPLALLVTNSVLGADALAPREAAVSEFRGSFTRYQASLKDAPLEEPPKADNDEARVKLETFSVVGSIAQHDLEHAIQEHAAEQERTEIERSFSWKRGGLIASETFGQVTADLGFWPGLEGIYLRGAFGAENIRRLRVNILHARW